MSDTPQHTREELLLHSRQVHEQLEALLALLSDEEQTQSATTEDGWTVKDHLAHLTWWEQRVIRMLGGAADPIAEIPGDGEDANVVNAYVFAANRDRPLAEVRSAFDASYLAMLHVIATVPDAVLAERYDWISSNADSHYDEHLRILLAWRERAAPQ
jgi:hypothetical protein